MKRLSKREKKRIMQAALMIILVIGFELLDKYAPDTLLKEILMFGLGLVILFLILRLLFPAGLR